MDRVDDIPGPADAADHAIEAPPSIGRDERRMHVRAYNMWVAMLDGRSFPDVAALEPARLGDLARHGVLLDFTHDADDPAIAWLGEALRREGEMTDAVRTIAQVPERSLLSRLVTHTRQAIASRTPIGFEAEFVNVRDNTALYRGILMPFSSDGETIDHVYGVINWKEVVDPQTAAEIIAAARAAMLPATPPPAVPMAPVWADGPSRQPNVVPMPAAAGALPGMLPLLSDAGDRCHAAEQRARDTLFQALGTAYDFAAAADADAAGYAALLAAAGLRAQPKSPWQPIVRLVFGDRLSRACATEYADVLAHAWRHDVAPGELPRFLMTHPENMRRIAAAERACRRVDAD